MFRKASERLHFNWMGRCFLGLYQRTYISSVLEARRFSGSIHEELPIHLNGASCLISLLVEFKDCNHEAGS